MSLGSIFTSNLAVMIKAHEDIGAATLEAAAREYWKEARKIARKGMIHGDFVTGKMARSIKYEVNYGERLAIVGVPWSAGIKYPMYWQLGHKNVFIGRALGVPGGVYVRVPWIDLARHKAEASSNIEHAAWKAADEVARAYSIRFLERMVGLTPIGTFRSTLSTKGGG